MTEQQNMTWINEEMSGIGEKKEFVKNAGIRKFYIR